MLVSATVFTTVLYCHAAQCQTLIKLKKMSIGGFWDAGLPRSIMKRRSHGIASMCVIWLQR